MSETPWLTIVGLAEDGPAGLSAASLAALQEAEVIMGPPRHLSLLPDLADKHLPWPVPFADGIPHLLEMRGRRVVALASGDPFWFGAGAVLARHLDPGEWRALPGPSCFSLVAARLGWPLETTLCIGLHAAPLTRLRPHLAPGLRAVVLLRDGAAVADLGAYLEATGFGSSHLVVCEALGGPRETLTEVCADALAGQSFAAPVCVAVEVAGAGAVLPLASGRADHWFANDGQITRRPVRALTLSALAPRRGEHLWDIGGGSGSIALEWLMAHPSLTATSFEVREDRAARIRDNAAALGLDRLNVLTGQAPAILDGQRLPQAVFIGGGLSADLLARLEDILPAGTRLVANAVTLESEALLAHSRARLGGALLRMDLAEAEALGTRQGWAPGRPIVQWSVSL